MIGYKELLEAMPGRERELERLVQILGERMEPVPACVLVSGGRGVGKSTSVMAALRVTNTRYGVLHAAECSTPAQLWAAVGRVLLPSVSGATPLTARELVLQLQTVTDGNRLALVVEQGELLRRLPNAAVHALLNLRYLADINVCIIIISSLVLENLMPMFSSQHIVIYFNNYSRDELFRILLLNHKTFLNIISEKFELSQQLSQQLLDPSLFMNFLNGFLSVFYRPCRDLIELRLMAKIAFVKYCEPAISEEVSANDLNRLWRHVIPVLQNQLEYLYLRIESDVSEVLQEKENGLVEDSARHDWALQIKSTKVFAQSFELPYFTKFLLIAAFLASYNPPKHDKRLFMKNHGKIKKRKNKLNNVKPSEKQSTQLGPKVFSLERLLNIFYGIVEECERGSSKLLEQISVLVQLRLLAEAGVRGSIMAPSYRCLVGLHFVTAIADSLQFRLKKYLLV